MLLTVNLQQIASHPPRPHSSFLIRYEHGKTSGIRTTMPVCLAATLAMLQASITTLTHLEVLIFQITRPIRTLQLRQTSILEPWRPPFRKP
jgi:hypothetical protein